MLWQNLSEAFATRFPAIENLLVERVGEARIEKIKEGIGLKVEESLNSIPAATQEVLSRIGIVIGVGTGLAIVPVYLFFLLKDDRDFTDDLENQLVFLKKEHRDDLLFLVKEFVSSLEAFFRGQILIGLIIGIMLAIAFTAMGVNFGMGLGLLIGVLNIIPYFGTIIGLGTVLPIAYFQPDGGLTLMLLALGAFVLVQVIEGYFLTPKIMGERTGLHPMTIIIAIFFWGVALDGLLGMILAIPLTAFFVVVWRLAKKKYLRYFSGVEMDSEEENSGSDEIEDDSVEKGFPEATN